MRTRKRENIVLHSQLVRRNMSQHLSLTRFPQVLTRAPTANHLLSSASSKTAVTALCHLPVVRHQMAKGHTRRYQLSSPQVPLSNVISAAVPLSRQRVLVMTACRRTLLQSRSPSTNSIVPLPDLMSRSMDTTLPLLFCLKLGSLDTVSKLSTSSLKSRRKDTANRLSSSIFVPHSPKITNRLPLLRLQFHNLYSTSRLHLSKSCHLDATNMPSPMTRLHNPDSTSRLYLSKSCSPDITNRLPLLRLQFHNLYSTSRLHLSKSCSLDVTHRMPSPMPRFRSLPRHRLSATVLPTLSPLRQSRKSVNAKNPPSMPNQTLSITATTTASSLLQRNSLSMSRSLAPIPRRFTRLHPRPRHLEKSVLYPNHLTRCRLSQPLIRSFQILLHLFRH
jgi:hypothetical protein